jgi:imidazolonepropionase-like amidohydrolase
MRQLGLLLACIITAAACSTTDVPTQATEGAQNSGTLFEGARLIVGDASAPIENSAMLVEGDRIVRIGRKGEIVAQSGTARVDLTGKTVMPALVSTHVHVGLLKGLSFGTENYTRDVLVDHLNRYAYYGVGTVLTAGTDVGSLSFEVRDERTPGAARLLTSGRGMAAPDAGPGIPSIAGTSYPISTAEEGRKAVQEVAANGANAVKIWVDDRGGRVKKLTPEIFRPIIEEAHKHRMLAIAHVFYLDDARGLVEGGINGFIHLIRDAVMDDGLVAAMKERGVFMAPNLGGTHRRTVSELPREALDLLAETVPSDIVEHVRRSTSDVDPKARATTRALYDIMRQNAAKLNAAGVTLVLGGDTGIPGAYHGWAEQYELEQMVDVGMTPAQVIVGATSAAARVLRLDDVGVLATGKTADFLVLDANPLDDITNTRRISSVYLRGHRVNRAALRTRWIAAGTE